MNCNQCPRKCNTDRSERLGFCGASHLPTVATVCLHTGEEPPVSGMKGIVNVFFTHCNLHCLYCQNHDISGRVVDEKLVRFRGSEAIAVEVERLLPQSEGLVGFVTPSHCPETVIEVVEKLRFDGFSPVVVYNSGGYDSVETLRRLEPYIDIYLPDFKYADSQLAARLSSAPDYPDVALAALREMYRQKGSGLMCDERGMAYRGMIVRHLVLPGHVDNSLAALELLADNLPMNLHLSLMAQYFPPDDCSALLAAGEPDLCRTLTADEYNRVVDRYNSLGFYNGWLQELCAESSYRPHFDNTETPFR